MLGFREQGVGSREQGTGKKSCVPYSYEKRCKYDQIMINAISFLKIKLPIINEHLTVRR